MTLMQEDESATSGTEKDIHTIACQNEPGKKNSKSTVRPSYSKAVMYCKVNM